jgi:hypothetical protein
VKGCNFEVAVGIKPQYAHVQVRAEHGQQRGESESTIGCQGEGDIAARSQCFGQPRRGRAQDVAGHLKIFLPGCMAERRSPAIDDLWLDVECVAGTLSEDFDAAEIARGVFGDARMEGNDFGVRGGS